MCEEQENFNVLEHSWLFIDGTYFSYFSDSRNIYL